MQRPIVTFYGASYEVDTESIRASLVRYDVEHGPHAGNFAKLAEKLGVSHMTLRRFRNGDKVGLDSVNKILANLADEEGRPLSFDRVFLPTSKVA